MVAYRKPPNLRDILVKSKVPEPPPLRPARLKNGMKKCNKNNCGTCPYVIEGNRVKSQVTGDLFNINFSSDCETKNLIYCIVCTKCKQNYIGETKRSLKARFGDQLGYVRNKNLKEPTGKHFNLPGHNITMMQISVLEKVWSSSDALRKERETMYINKFQSKYLGLNRKS